LCQGSIGQLVSLVAIHELSEFMFIWFIPIDTRG